MAINQMAKVLPLFFENIPFKRTKPLFWDWRFSIVSDDQRHATKWPENAVREGEWKLYYNAKIDSVELYNIMNDPFENNNLSKRNIAKVDNLLGLLTEWKTGLPE